MSGENTKRILCNVGELIEHLDLISFLKLAVWPRKHSLQNLNQFRIAYSIAEKNQLCCGDKLRILCLPGFVCGGLLRLALENRIRKCIHGPKTLIFRLYNLKLLSSLMDLAYDSQKAGEIHISLF